MILVSQCGMEGHARRGKWTQLTAFLIDSLHCSIDIYCLPYVSSIVDVVGQLLLVAAFGTAIFLGDNITTSLGTSEGNAGA